MPVLSPFRGLRYAAPAVTDYSAVICPPYDVISAADRERLAARSPVNAVHVELPAGYDEAGRLFAHWQANGTLRRDERQMIYVYEQRYQLADRLARTATGFMCRLRLQPPDGDLEVHAHEHTMSAPKEDRFRLMSAVRANLSPVILLYEAGPDLTPGDLLSSLTARPPDQEAVDDAGVRHRLWAVDAAAVPAAATLLAGVSRLPLTIADGHHRYATALRFCAEVGGAGSDEVLALLFEANTGGLSVLATHRVVKAAGIDVLERATETFSLAPVANSSDATPAAPGEIGVWTRAGGARMRARMAPNPSSSVEKLDVSVLSAALPALVGASVDELTSADRISYTQDAASAVGQVNSGRADAAFLLAPTPVAAVIAVAAAGQVMPPKSTFFYPKAATGLVFNPLVP